MLIVALLTTAKMWKQHKCLWTDEWIKEMWYIYTIEYYSAIKKSKIMPPTATWMQLEIFILSEVRQRQIPCDITYMYNLKYDTNELIYKTEIDQQTENRLVVAKGEWEGSGMDWEFGVSRCKLLHLEKISNKVLLYSTGKCLGINHCGR